MDALKTVPAQHEAGDALTRICAFLGAAVTTLHLEPILALEDDDHDAASASAAFQVIFASATPTRKTDT